jgi:release factor glutamine methyltransferase
MTLQQATQHLVAELESLYEPREAAAITALVMGHISGLGKIDRIINKNDPLSLDQTQLLQTYKAALLRHQPVQYVLQEAWFGGMKFEVNAQVLIPRPETEELVAWAVERGARVVGDPTKSKPISILDVGTGSGCIAILLKKKMPQATLYGCDISAGALRVARTNARHLQAHVHFLQLDFLRSVESLRLPEVDLIVSNPPYIPLHEKSSLAPHVAQYEPPTALFVPSEDPLIFYRALAGFAQKKLSIGGELFVEVHTPLARQVQGLFTESGLSDLEMRKDMFGNERFIKVAKG